MSIDLRETPASRAQQYGTASTDEVVLTYKSTGEQDDATVRNYVWNNTPTTVTGLTGTLYRKNINIRPDGWNQYIVEVSYGGLNVTTIPQNSYTFNFDTTGGTVNVKVAKAHVQSYPTAGDPHKGVIGVQQDGGVDGADIIIPKLKFTLAFKYPAGVITVSFIKSLAAVTGTTNAYRFLGFDPGELLFLGATGSDGTAQEMEVSFAFEASQNATGLTIGGITGIAKGGHEYGWAEFGDVVDSGKAAVNATAVHIERVYNSADWASVFNWNIYTSG